MFPIALKVRNWLTHTHTHVYVQLTTVIYFGRASLQLGNFQRVRRVLMVSSMCFGVHETEHVGLAAIALKNVSSYKLKEYVWVIDYLKLTLLRAPCMLVTSVVLLHTYYSKKNELTHLNKSHERAEPKQQS